MPFHLYKVRNTGEEPRWYGVRIEFEEDHWVSTCKEVDAEGRDIPEGAQIAPRFYGVTARQAQRKIVETLEATYDEVVSAAERTPR